MTKEYEDTASALGAGTDDLWKILDRVTDAGRVYRALERAAVLITCGQRDTDESQRELWPRWFAEDHQ